jgi:ABC-type polysaccharide/polyol phosphate export permease
MINTLLKPFVKFIPENNRYERIWKLAQVDFKKRYYNDKLGLFWALLNPLFKIAIYYMVFTHVFKIDIENYAVFLFAGLILWMAWTEASGKGLSIIQSKKYLIQNIKFNHIDLYISLTISVFIGFMFNLAAYLIFVLGVGIPWTLNILYMPLILLNVFILCIGTSMILTVIQIYFKDIKHMWAIITLAGFWSSGIFRRGELFLEAFPPLRVINPFVGIVMNMRAISFDGIGPDWHLMGINYATGLVVLITGLLLYRNYSHKAIEMM